MLRLGHLAKRLDALHHRFANRIRNWLGWIVVLGGPNINTVFKPLFENNILYIK